MLLTQVQSYFYPLPATPTICTNPYIYTGIYGADNKTAPATGAATLASTPIGIAVNGVAVIGNTDLQVGE